MNNNNIISLEDDFVIITKEEKENYLHLKKEIKELQKEINKLNTEYKSSKILLYHILKTRTQLENHFAFIKVCCSLYFSKILFQNSKRKYFFLKYLQSCLPNIFLFTTLIIFLNYFLNQNK